MRPYVSIYNNTHGDGVEVVPQLFLSKKLAWVAIKSTYEHTQKLDSGT